MSIQIKADVVVGFRFSDMCARHETKKGVTFRYVDENLTAKIANEFEDAEIVDEQVNPELLAVIFDQDFFPFDDGKDAIIGQRIVGVDIGNRNVECANVKEVERAKNKVVAALWDAIPEWVNAIPSAVVIEISVVGGVQEQAV